MLFHFRRNLVRFLRNCVHLTARSDLWRIAKARSGSSLDLFRLYVTRKGIWMTPSLFYWRFHRNCNSRVVHFGFLVSDHPINPDGNRRICGKTPQSGHRPSFPSFALQIGTAFRSPTFLFENCVPKHRELYCGESHSFVEFGPNGLSHVPIPWKRCVDEVGRLNCSRKS